MCRTPAKQSRLDTFFASPATSSLTATRRLVVVGGGTWCPTSGGSWSYGQLVICLNLDYLYKELCLVCINLPCYWRNARHWQNAQPDVRIVWLVVFFCFFFFLGNIQLSFLSSFDSPTGEQLILGVKTVVLSKILGTFIKHFATLVTYVLLWLPVLFAHVWVSFKVEF